MRKIALFLLTVSALWAQNPNAAVFPGRVATDQDLFVAANLVSSTLAAPVAANATTLTFTSSMGPAPVVIAVESEIFHCSSVSVFTYTCVPNAEPTPANLVSVPHNAGVTARNITTAWHHNQLAAETKAIETKLSTFTGGGSVFTGSTGVTSAFSATPTFNLADISVQSPIIFQPGQMTASVTSVIFQNPKAGAEFYIAWKNGTGGGFSVNYNGSVAGLPVCSPIDPGAGATTLQHFIISADGTTINGAGCISDSTNPSQSEQAAPSTPGAGFFVCWGDSTAHTGTECMANGSANVYRMVQVFTGTATLGTSAIASATCATVVTVSATGVATTDVVAASFNGDPTAITGYVPLTTGMLTIIGYPTANNVNFKVCNNTAASITPGAATLNWKVAR